MRATVHYFETGTKEVRSVIGHLFFGDAMFGDYIGVKEENVDSTRGTIVKKYTLVPSACVITIETPELDEELYMVDTESMKRSKQAALNRMNTEIDRDNTNGRPFQ